MISGIDWLNEKLQKFVMENIYIEEENKFDEAILIELDKIVEILIKNVPKFTLYPYKEKISLEKSIEYATEFLDYLDPEYANYLIERINDGTIEFIPPDNIDDIEDDITYSYSTFSDDKRKIKIYYKNTYNDIYTIIHEIFHDMNLIVPDDLEKYNEYTRSLFTETVSILATTIAKDYFVKKYPNKKEFTYNLKAEIYELYNYATKLDFAMRLIKTFIENSFISSNDIFNILDDKSDYYVETVKEYFDEIKNPIFEQTDLNVFYMLIYLEGILIVFNILDKYPKEEERINILKELNVMIMEYSTESIYDYIDLEYNKTSYNEIDENNVLQTYTSYDGLKNETFEELEKSYIKQIKKI